MCCPLALQPHRPPSRPSAVRRGVWIVLATACLSLSSPAATNTASIHLYSTSIEIGPGQASELGQLYGMLFSSYADWAAPNGEFYTFFGEVPQTNYSALLLYDANYPPNDMPIAQGAIAVIIPHELDDPVDGIPDFYQVSEDVNAVVSGGTFAVADPGNPDQVYDAGSVSAHWERAAGEHRGTCTLTLSGGSLLFSLPTAFVHPFEIREFVGTYRYVPSLNAVIEGKVDVEQIGDSTRHFEGGLKLERTSNDPGIEFYILPATWTNGTDQATDLLGWYFFDHDLRYELEYFGLLSVADGDASTADEDFYDYFVAIDDPNDTDADGVPDLSDPVPRQPLALRLRLSYPGREPWLEVQGRPGDILEVQMSSDPMAVTWPQALASSITLTNALQEIPLPTPLSGVVFYRVALLNP